MRYDRRHFMLLIILGLAVCYSVGLTFLCMIGYPCFIAITLGILAIIKIALIFKMYIDRLRDPTDKHYTQNVIR